MSVETTVLQAKTTATELMETAVNGWFSILEAEFHLKSIFISTTTFSPLRAVLNAQVTAKFHL